MFQFDAGWSSLVARRAHNPKVVGSNPAPATIEKNKGLDYILSPCFICIAKLYNSLELQVHRLLQVFSSILVKLLI